MAIKRIQRGHCDLIRKAAQKALDEHFPKDLGLVIDVGNAKFTNANVTFKLEFAVTNADGVVMSKEATDFNRYAFMHPKNLEGGLGKKFRCTQHGELVLEGFAPKSRKFPYLFRVVKSGKMYKFSEDFAAVVTPVK